MSMVRLVGVVLGGWCAVATAVGVMVGRFLEHRPAPAPLRVEPIRSLESRRGARTGAVAALR